MMRPEDKLVGERLISMMKSSYAYTILYSNMEV
jgi:hypothetical protein